VLNVDGCNYLAVISAISKVGQLNKANINKVTAIKLLPFKVSLFYYNMWSARTNREPRNILNDWRCQKFSLWWILFFLRLWFDLFPSTQNCMDVEERNRSTETDCKWQQLFLELGSLQWLHQLARWCKMAHTSNLGLFWPNCWKSRTNECCSNFDVPQNASQGGNTLQCTRYWWSGICWQSVRDWANFGCRWKVFPKSCLG
jgi:hypothetical protein